MNLSFYRPTVAEIDLDAMTHNVNLFRERVANKVDIMAVVKADAYAHGVIPIVRHLKSIGISYFSVGFLEEALQIRNSGIMDPILVLGYTPQAGIELAFKNDITLTIFSLETLDYIDEVGERLQKKLKVHVKVDTGMGRVGISPQDTTSFLQELDKAKWIEIEGIYTHFASADEADKGLTLKQYELFKDSIAEIKKRVKNPYIHASNSAALIDLPYLEQNIARLGISLYGLLPSNEVNITYNELKPVMSIKTRIVFLKKIQPGQTVSYGATFTAKRETLVATLPIGYADGLSRRLSNKGFVLVEGKRAPIIGRVCMDQIMVDVTDFENVNIGSEVIIFGNQKESFLSIDEHAELVGTVNYELITLIGKRIPRVYYKAGEIVDVSNYLLS